jgi:hypothetical protein
MSADLGGPGTCSLWRQIGWYEWGAAEGPMAAVKLGVCPVCRMTPPVLGSRSCGG